MKATIELDLQPFTTPNFVRTSVDPGDASKEGYAIAIRELDSLTLERLCDEFRTAVFGKAGKPFPPIAAHRCDCGKLVTKS